MCDNILMLLQLICQSRCQSKPLSAMGNDQVVVTCVTEHGPRLHTFAAGSSERASAAILSTTFSPCILSLNIPALMCAIFQIYSLIRRSLGKGPLSSTFSTRSCLQELEHDDMNLPLLETRWDEVRSLILSSMAVNLMCKFSASG